MKTNRAKTKLAGIAIVCAIVVMGCGGGKGGAGGTNNSPPTAPSSAAPAPPPPPPPPPPLPAGSVVFSDSSYTVAQSTGLLTVTVNRVDGSRDGSVSYATADGTAVAGTHYTARSGTLTWANGDASGKTISLPIATTPTHSGGKSFTLTLSSPSNEITLGSPATATINITGTPPASHSVRVQDNRLIDGAGNVLQLRGASFSGFEFVAINGFNPADPSGGQAGQPNGPRWSALKNWRANTIRFALNEASWLGYSCVDTDGVTRNPDPGGNYRSHIQEQVKQATDNRLYVILELHWAAPGNTCPMVQTQMANTDHSLAFWTSVANTFKNNPAVLFSLYNEPFIFGLSEGVDPWVVLMNGGTLSYYPATSGTFNYKNINTPWQVAGMQSLIDAVRATGATNVVMVGGVDFGNNLSGWLKNRPRDPLNQLAAAWHPYPPMQLVFGVSVATAGTNYSVGDTLLLPKPNTVYEPARLRVTSVDTGGGVTGVSIVTGGMYLQTKPPTGAVAQGSTSGSGTGATFNITAWHNFSSTWSMPENWPTVQAISAHVPVIMAETGEHNAPGTEGAPFLQEFLPFAGANNWSVIGCCWNVFSEPNNVLIKDADGTPTDGYGKVFRDWMTGVAWQ